MLSIHGVFYGHFLDKATCVSTYNVPSVFGTVCVDISLVSKERSVRCFTIGRVYSRSSYDVKIVIISINLFISKNSDTIMECKLASQFI